MYCVRSLLGSIFYVAGLAFGPDFVFRTFAGQKPILLFESRPGAVVNVNFSFLVKRRFCITINFVGGESLISSPAFSLVQLSDCFDFTALPNPCLLAPLYLRRTFCAERTRCTACTSRGVDLSKLGLCLHTS